MDPRVVQQAEQALRAGRAGEAKRLLEGELARHPGDPVLLRGMAAACSALGDVDGAIHHLKRRVRRAPRPLTALDELARYCLAHGRAEAAVEAYQRFVSRHPESAVAHFNCAWYATRLGRHDLALEHYQRALELGVERPAEVHLNVAKIHAELLNDDAGARRHLERALELEPRYAAAWYNLGNLAEQQGRRDEARRCFGRCLEVEPANDAALARLADAHDFGGGAEEALFGRLAEAAGRSADADLHVAYGRAQEQRGLYADAWRHYALANEQDRRAHPPYDPAESERNFDRIIATCDAPWLARMRLEHPADPVFICGLFRSGSTLVEQILGAHPAFTPAGERAFLPRLVARQLPRYPEGLERLEPRQVQAWARAYDEESRRLFAPGTRLTDKRPDNVRYLGLVKAMFPRARIVVTRRDWRDVATSIFATRLGPSAPYATDLGHIRHFVEQHERLIAHWQALLGGDLVTVHYESLVADPRTEIGRVLDALGERWDERCLAFHEQRNTVRTASVWQVRQPLYRASVGRWSRFRDDFVAALGPGVDAEPASPTGPNPCGSA